MGTQNEIFLDGEVYECAAPIRDMPDPETDDVLRGPRFDPTPFEQDGAGIAHLHVADRAQQRGLAGSVGTQQGGDAALRNHQTEVVNDRNVPIRNAELAHFEQRRHAAAPR